VLSFYQSHFLYDIMVNLCPSSQLAITLKFITLSDLLHSILYIIICTISLFFPPFLSTKKFDFPDIDIFACRMLLAAPSEIRKSEYKEDGLPVDVKFPIKHLITRELQVYSFGMSFYFFKKFHIFFLST